MLFFLCLLSMADNKRAETISLSPHIYNPPNLGRFRCGLDCASTSGVWRLALCFSFFQAAYVDFQRQNLLFMNSACTVYVFKNIKNGSHGTIHTFKNYFTKVFSVFSFSKNKFNPNGSLKGDSGFKKLGST